MADKKTTGLDELTTPPADNDFVGVIDVSDTSMAATGTNKKNLAKHYLRTNGTANTVGAHLDINGYNLINAGRIGVGVNPSYPLHISAASGIQAVINATSGQYTQVTLQNAGVDKISIGWDNSGGYGYIASDSAFIIMDAGRVNFTNEIGGAWTNAPTFNTGWGNYGGGEQVAQYKKFGDIVMLRGLVARSSGSQTTIFTLPSGYRPPAYSRFRQSSNTGDGQIDVAPTGEIVFSAGGAGWISLDRIIFSTV